jgi:predicted DNA-binding ArsR family transcriptional regulator
LFLNSAALRFVSKNPSLREPVCRGAKTAQAHVIAICVRSKTVTLMGSRIDLKRSVLILEVNNLLEIHWEKRADGPKAFVLMNVPELMRKQVNCFVASADQHRVPKGKPCNVGTQ